MSIKKLEELLKIKYENKMRLAVVAAHDGEVLEAVFEAKKLDIIEPILIGDMEKIKEIGKRQNIDMEKFKL